MNLSFVAILMGSESDWPVMQAATEILKQLEIEFEVRISSAHRTPEATTSYVVDATDRGCAVFICGAGMAAHLAGAVAAHTLRPVIGVPIDSGPLAGFDALLATVQMPGGIPVATVAVGKAGAKNAGYLAAQMLAVDDADLTGRLAADRQTNQDKIRAQNDRLQAEL
ncbi:MAG: 5-(carboxyamino)imidazole ribonucleotide mutase [Pseudomonadales bacterium]|nr:5-(carboxyamino)imidazole ribonucleotide mutase [Pseudomonadales bacterium]MDP6471440.1 5-(carboxyamino)imidazole ribonucleotide mutase [Pseudomonadales bacterium]MDP6828609.1 5-(carboxyamino)imidazole ribonucleotide mutase [Pseudomonadales bacterium]MDP6973208.1 5-(carboxyamino)imidazole ribonucleotide mutase [Pseudomonadales bacterium]